MSEVELVWVPDKAEDLISMMARVSNPRNENNTETAPRLLRYLIKHKHWSPFELVAMCVKIKCSRAIGRQLLRHRSFTFQEYCVARDSKIKVEGNKEIPIEILYRFYKNRFPLPKVKVYDQEAREFCHVKIKEVFETGIKPVYELVIGKGTRIKATKDHKFLTKEGFKRLEELKVGDKVGMNGVPCYRNKEWLEKMKKESLQYDGIAYIARVANINYNTIRKWLKIHGLQYTKQETAQYTQIWNKGLAAELQPGYGKIISEETRTKMSNSARKGKDSNLWTRGVEDRDERMLIADWQNRYRFFLLNKFNHQCVICESKTDLQIDHIKSVGRFPELAYEVNNLQILCKPCHREKSVKEMKLAPKYVKVKSIKYVGEEITYDLQVDHDSHNYIANHIVTHNSLRYSEPDIDPLLHTVDTRMQSTKNRQDSTFCTDDELMRWWVEHQMHVSATAQQVYKRAVQKGIAKELARAVLPEGLTPTTLYMQGTLRSWIHFVQLRLAKGSQLEIREIALRINNIIAEYFPNVHQALRQGDKVFDIKNFYQLSEDYIDES